MATMAISNHQIIPSSSSSSASTSGASISASATLTMTNLDDDIDDDDGDDIDQLSSPTTILSSLPCQSSHVQQQTNSSTSISSLFERVTNFRRSLIKSNLNRKNKDKSSRYVIYIEK